MHMHLHLLDSCSLPEKEDKRHWNLTYCVSCTSVTNERKRRAVSVYKHGNCEGGGEKVDTTDSAGTVPVGGN